MHVGGALQYMRLGFRKILYNYVHTYKVLIECFFYPESMAAYLFLLHFLAIVLRCVIDTILVIAEGTFIFICARFSYSSSSFSRSSASSTMLLLLMLFRHSLTNLYLDIVTLMAPVRIRNDLRDSMYVVDACVWSIFESRQLLLTSRMSELRLDASSVLLFIFFFY